MLHTILGFVTLLNCKIFSGVLQILRKAWDNLVPTRRIFILFHIWGLFNNRRKNTSFIKIWQE